MSSRQAKHAAQQRPQRIAAGLCAQCGQPRAAGAYRCAQCNAARRDAAAALMRARRKAGLA